MQQSIFSRMQTTKFKITCAKILYIFVTLFLRQKNRHIVRNGIRYAVDLTEGIDLSLFLFGSFQQHVTHNAFYSLPVDAVAFDVGANFGVMTLQLAKAASEGHVYAFEPTHYAFKRLIKNLKLNPELARRITPVQVFLSDHTQTHPQIKAYSSWKVGGNIDKTAQHPIHLGAVKSAEGVEAVSLDDFCTHTKITRLDFIKIDTDGHDYKVLKGARKTILKLRPVVIFEVGDYPMKEEDIDFTFYLDYFQKCDYSLFDTKSGKSITRQNYPTCIPIYGAIDAIAFPNQPDKIAI